MSPHIIIDVALDGLEDKDCAGGNIYVVQTIIANMMTDELITIEEFHHYCGRLMKIIDGRKQEQTK